MRRSHILSSGVLLAMSAVPVLAQQKAPAVRAIGSTVATSSDSILTVSALRHLPNGKVLVNDLMSRRVVMLDANLKIEKVVADTTDATAKAYGGGMGNLVAYKGDSTLYVDASSLSMLVIDPAGNVARVMAIPRSQEAGMMATSALGGMGFDGERMVYRGGMGGIRMNAPRPVNTGAASSGPMIGSPTIPDTMPIMRVNLATRAVDTAGWVKVSNPKTNINRTDSGISVSIEINPLPTIDEYAVLADGRLAIVRGRDYHVEFIEPNGNVTKGAKIPFEWKRLSDEEKSAFIDSVKVATERQVAAGGGSAAARAGAAMGAAIGGSGGPPMTFNTQVRVAGPAGGEPPMRGGAQTFQMAAPTTSFVSPSELPDYQPAFFGNSARGDMDGNLWVRIIPPKPIAGGAVYDVINGKGELIDRVQVPVNRSIIGFGPKGTVYMSAMENGKLTLERATFN